MLEHAKALICFLGPDDPDRPSPTVYGCTPSVPKAGYPAAHSEEGLS